MKKILVLMLCFAFIGCLSKKAPLHTSLDKKVINIAVLSESRNVPQHILTAVEGRLMQDSLISSAMNTFNKKQTGIKIVSRTHINKVLQEQQFSLSGLTEKETNVLGRLLNTDIITIITQVNLKTNDKHYSKKSLVFKDNLKCITRLGYAQLAIKVLRADNGEVLISDNFESDNKFNECSSNNPDSDLPMVDQVKSEALKAAANKFSSKLKSML